MAEVLIRFENLLSSISDLTQQDSQEETEALPPPKPLSGGGSGMPSWADYMKQLEQEELSSPTPASETVTTKKPPPKKSSVPAKKAATAPALSAEDEEKKRLRKEQEEKRRQEMKELMAKKETRKQRQHTKRYTRCNFQT